MVKVKLFNYELWNDKPLSYMITQKHPGIFFIYLLSFVLHLRSSSKHIRIQNTPNALGDKLNPMVMLHLSCHCPPWFRPLFCHCGNAKMEANWFTWILLTPLFLFWLWTLFFPCHLDSRFARLLPSPDTP